MAGYSYNMNHSIWIFSKSYSHIYPKLLLIAMLFPLSLCQNSINNYSHQYHK